MRSREAVLTISSSSESSDTESDSNLASNHAQFRKYLSKIAKKHTSPKDAAKFAKFVATLYSGTVKRPAGEPLPDLAKRKKRNILYTCEECEKNFEHADALKKHKETCNQEPDTPDANEKEFACDKCDKSYRFKTGLQKHVQNQHSACTRSNKNKSKSIKCRLCKDLRVDIYKHYGNKHNIDNIEQMLFDDGTVLVTSDIDTDMGKAEWFQEQLEKASERYNNNTTCRLCDANGFDSTVFLKTHYTDHHKVDATSLKFVKRLFRAEMKAHLNETDRRSERAVRKSNMSDKKKVIVDEKKTKPKTTHKDKDNTRFIYICNCFRTQESYDAAVEHAQEHLVAKYNNTEISQANTLVYETNINDKIHIKMVRYNFDALLTDAWYEIFNNVATYKDRILSSSIYKHSRSVKLHSEDTESCTGVPMYKCEGCQLFFHPTEVEGHFKKCKVCSSDASKKFICEICDIRCYSEDALEHHKENHAQGFKLVTFNNKNDKLMNWILGKLQSHSTDDSDQEEIEDNPIKGANDKRVEITSVSKFIDGERFVNITPGISVCPGSVNNEPGNRETTEEPLHVNQVNDGTPPAAEDVSGNVNSKVIDAEHTYETDSSCYSNQSPIHLEHDADIHTYSIIIDDDSSDV